MSSGNGIKAITINGETKHITDLTQEELCKAWSKCQHELNELYEINYRAKQGWRGLILKMIGVHLPDRNRNIYFIGGKSTNKNHLTVVKG